VDRETVDSLLVSSNELSEGRGVSLTCAIDEVTV